MPIDWSTLITDPKEGGRISLHRLRKFCSIAMGVLGALAMLGALILEVVTGVSVPLGMVGVVGGVLVAPMTGGAVADALAGKSLAAKIQSGELPDRRSSAG